ncbi:MAG TPA: hypothetical protein VF708_08030 [Pyrinomonadaceae bacterium]|jgi:hypothetical protein
MLVSRRKFLKAGALVALASTVPMSAAISAQGQQRPMKPSTGGQPPPSVYNDPLFYYDKATFTTALKTRFVIQTLGFRGIVLTLAEVKDIGPVPDQAVAGKECFSLLFRSANALKQRTYTLKHEVMGTFDLFLVPLPKDRLGRRYIAIINRLNS